ncbi:MAG TPA: nucleoside monophosphate kinase [Bryobacteraceae bacterium]|nr:nucleoside monophosphate kinase [Bryobacteraceae bacterium]
MPSRGLSTPLPALPRVILFLGSPGSGKGTQSSLLAAKMGIPALSTGEMLRAEAQRKTAAGKKLRRILASGALVADDLVCEAVASRLRREMPRGGLILDGFPRTLAQAECLDDILRGMNLPGPTVLHLHVSRERIVARLAARRQCSSCGAVFNLVSRPSRRGAICENDGGALVEREDDSEAVILKRLTAFDLACAPLVEYYRADDYHWIDGDRSTAAVAAQLLSIVKARKPRREKAQAA